jgi:hypothetical protein
MRAGRSCRIQITFTVILCLLFQQVAVAAYLCPAEPAPVLVAMAHCASMDMQPDRSNPALCAQHCAPDVSLPADHAVPSVPPLALPPLHFALVLMPPADHAPEHREVPIVRSDPPPWVRFCSLLI